MTDVLGTVKNMPRTTALAYLDERPQQTTVEGIPVHAKTTHDYTDPKDVETKVIGNCEMYNLSKQEDRSKYADLLAELEAKDNVVVHFEERAITETGELLIYISYTEYIKLQLT